MEKRLEAQQAAAERRLEAQQAAAEGRKAASIVDIH